jgi:hypothetical protein
MGCPHRAAIHADALMRIAFALLLAAHAVAHLPGFLMAWNLLAVPETPFKTTVLGGRVDLGVPGIRLVGVAWLMTGVLVALAAIAVFRNSVEAYAVAWCAVAVSTAMTAVGWPDSKTGLVLNLVIIASLLVPLVA